MRCGRCGNENRDGNRFCGMCGAPLAAKAPVVEPTRPPAAPSPGSPTQGAPVVKPAGVMPPGVPLSGSSVAPKPAVVPPPNVVPVQPVPSAAIPRQAPVASGRRVEPLPASHRAPSYFEPSSDSSISGPSFLGLNTPSAGNGGERNGADFDDRSGSRQDNLRDSSGSLDYLLDDEGPRRGWGKLALGFVALALAVGLGYLHFRQGGFEWLKAANQKPAATSPDSAQSATNSSATTAPDNGTATPSANAAPATASNPPDSTLAPAQNSQNPPAAPGAATRSAAPENSAPANNSAANTAADSGSPAASAPPPQSSVKSEDSSDSDEESSDTEPAPKARTKAAVAKPAAKPAAAKPSPARAIDRVQEAERYIYGRGVPQDCDHGVRLLKSEQSDARAMISLGGLYSAGTCTPRDLPTAYRWFALALHKQPDNQTLQNDLQKLWSQMTGPERQLAIKLSQ